MNSINPSPSATIIIFGASGDLMQRKLVPALHTLNYEGYLSPDTRIIGIARSPLSDEAFLRAGELGAGRGGRVTG